MPVHDIRVVPKREDPVGHEVFTEMQRSIGVDGLEDVRSAKIYRVEGISEEEAEILASSLLSDPVSESFTVDEPVDLGSPLVIEVAYRPGVMNPEVGSLMKAALDLGIRPVAADSSREYAFIGVVSQAEVNAGVGRLLVNKTVQHFVTSSPTTLLHELRPGEVSIVPIINATPQELRELSKQKLFLDDAEMKVMQEHFKSLDREPTDVEVEIIAARWSEHCGHKTFNAKIIIDDVEKLPFYQRIKDEARKHFKDLVVSAFEDNSGVMRFYDGWALNGKVETHNSPSAIEPYGGAMTGTGGVFRDIMGTGQGAKVIISTDMFCFAPPDIDESLLPAGVLHPDYLQRRVVQGVSDYGNRMGVPTANGSVHFHEDFRAKPTVIVGAYGLLPESLAQKGEPQVGDIVVTIGSKTGSDGVHGATMSSGEMTEETADINAGAVQIGNPIEEKRMSDALLEARDLGLIRALTDCGAAGFSSAIGEMGENIGVTVDISLAPLKYPGLTPREIWISESQERMVAAISPENLERFIEVCRSRNVEAVALGTFDGSNTLTVNFGNQNVAELDYDFLKNGLPQRTMIGHYEPAKIKESIPVLPQNSSEWELVVKQVLSHGNVNSKEDLVRKYDTGVQGGNIVPPFGGIDESGPNDALVVRPLLGKPYGAVQSHGMNPILNRIDPYRGTMWAFAEAASNYVSVGGDINEAVVAGNYIWPFPDEESLGTLDISVDAAVKMMDLLDIPVITGKDSLSGTFRGDDVVIKIPEVHTVSIYGRIPDVEKTTTSDIKAPGRSALYLIGKQSSGMGGSTYYDVTGGTSSTIPEIDSKHLKDVLNRITKGIQNKQILACHDVSEGGLLVAVAEMCFGGGSGATLNILSQENPANFLFNETAGCFVIEVKDVDRAEEAFQGVPHRMIGFTVEEEKLDVRVNRWQSLFNLDMNALKKVWQAPVQEMYR